MGVSVPFKNNIVAGTTLVRDSINSPGFQSGIDGWIIRKDGSAEFNDVAIRGSIAITGNAQSSNYVPGISGWQLSSTGTAEFNGNVDMLSGVVTGDFESSNYVANTSGWRLRDTGEAEFNGVFLTGLVDGKVHTGALVDTTVTVLGSEVPVVNANTLNTPQIINHAYRATIVVSITGPTAGNRVRYRLWDGIVGVNQLGAHAPIFKIATPVAVFEAVTMVFVWKATSTQTIASINLGMEYFAGIAGNGVTTRIEVPSYLFIIDDLGLASRIAGL